MTIFSVASEKQFTCDILQLSEGPADKKQPWVYIDLPYRSIVSLPMCLCVWMHVVITGSLPHLALHMAYVDSFLWVVSWLGFN